MTNHWSLMLAVGVGFGVGCMDVAETSLISQEADRDGAPTKYFPAKEILDKGDEPAAYGCEAVYPHTDQTCSMAPSDEWGDYCESATKLMERTIGTTCDAKQPPAPKEYDCTRLLNDPKARCVSKGNVCLSGNTITGKTSARCEIPKTDNPKPGSDDYCVCPVGKGETIVANECPTKAGGSECPLATCTVSKDGLLENRPCDHYLDGGGSGAGSGAIGL